ncbi:MAG: DUF167 domain-containing protein [Acidimicrobiia bacterium]|nr:DUF167 domain-containing protein [Acidimicrobiia bacterium]
MFWVWVVPGSSRTEVAGLHGDALRVRLSSPPERGRANTQLVGVLAQLLGTRVELVGGTRSRRKRVCVSGMSAAAVWATLAQNVT